MLAREFIRHCLDNNLVGVTDCLARGLDVNTVNSSGQSALMFACSRGNSAIVSRLLEVPGLDVNYQDENGVTAAHLAVV